jgi:hypothetical protein
MSQKESEGAPDMYLGAASGQKFHVGIRLAGPHHVTDLKLPFHTPTVAVFVTV